VQETPIVSALIQMASTLRLPLHVPGHKQGRVLPAVLSQWLSVAAKLDLTELPGLDNLFEPTGCIQASQRLAAAHYQAAQCLYSVNGSTAGVIASILACAEGGHVLFLGPFHQSAWRALVIANARPVFHTVGWDAEACRSLPPSVEEVRHALQRPEQISAVYLTSPSYTGAVAPVQAIADVVHAEGIPLIVDEAHGAHFGLTESLPPHSIHAGADVVIQSVHKMLPALTQTGWILRQGPRVDGSRLEQALRMIQTTSPSYLLLASLDAAQAWLRQEGRAAAESTIASLRGVTDEWGSYPTDPLRHWIPTGSLAVSQAIQAELAAQGIYVEYADALGVLSIFGFGIREADVSRYTDVTSRFAKHKVQCEQSSIWQEVAHMAQSPNLIASPREVFQAPTAVVEVEAAVGRIAAALVTPYPPGVPMIFPGQLMTEAAVQGLQHLSGLGADIHGLPGEGKLTVLV
jgi:arginine decarboxylase